MDKIKINENINLVYIKDEKFKSNLITIYFKRPLDKEEVTKNALLPYVLKASSKNIKTKLELERKLQSLYGVTLSENSLKVGEKNIVYFRMSFSNPKYIGKDIFGDIIKILKEIIFNPNVEDNKFIKEYVDIEKESLKENIKAIINDKSKYAYVRAIENMFSKEKFSINEDGYLEDLKEINEENLYSYYRRFIKTSPIDVVISGDFGNINENNILNTIKENFNIKIDPVKIEKEKLHEKRDLFKVMDKMEVNQGKLVLGYTFHIPYEGVDNSYYEFLMFNSIFGSGVHSKLFKIVREKHSLCYSISSNIQKTKGTLLVGAGIDLDKKEDTVKIINEILEDMKLGKVSSEELDDAKKSYFYALDVLKDSLYALSDFYYILSLNDKPKTIEEIKKAIEKVEVKDIIKISKKAHYEMEYFLGR